jgi:cysteinyl-tRNA synthetase
MPLELYNTLRAKKEVFEPLQEKAVRMYVCGITPYDVPHLGHARCYVVFDLLRRVLKTQGYSVRFVQNFTDVDDKIIARAAERGIGTVDLVNQNIDDFFNKMDALGVQRADVYPRVTEHIPDIIALVRKLIDKKAAYVLGGDVYYAVKTFPNYGKLSKRPLEDLQSGARIEINKEKRDPLDFALWKASKPNEPPEVCWDSPWGKGRPGWHIECSVMALKHLGANFDIHGGGLDLVFPHHENEIAQSEGATGLPFANFWVHNGFVTRNQVKMSKSLGNFFTLTEIFAKYHPSVVRYMFLTTHYRSPLDFSDELLDQSRQSLSRLKDGIARATFVVRKQGHRMTETHVPDPAVVTDVEKLGQEFQKALSDDLNTPEAIGVVHRLSKVLDRQFESNELNLASIRYVLDRMRALAEILGLDLFSFLQGVLIPPEVSELAAQRQQARADKQWKEADRLRDAILGHGYVVEDTPNGPRLLPKASS